MVAHIQKYHDMHIRPNITKAEWDHLKTFKAQQELIKLLADKGPAIVFEKDQKYIKRNKLKLKLWIWCCAHTLIMLYFIT